MTLHSQKSRFVRYFFIMALLSMVLLQLTSFISHADSPMTKEKNSKNTSYSSKKDAAHLTPAEIQGAVMSFADTFAATISELSADLENESTSDQGRLYAAEMKLFGISKPTVIYGLMLLLLAV